MPIDHLSTTFAALADPTRRAILARLASGECSVTELAEPFDMSLPAVSKHLRVLERAGLIARRREAQWRPCRIEARPAQGSGRLDRALPAHLGRAARSIGRLPTRTESKGGKVMVVSSAANSDTFKVTTPSDQEIRMTRLFDAPRQPRVRGDDEARTREAVVGPPGRGLLGSCLRDRPSRRAARGAS